MALYTPGEEVEITWKGPLDWIKHPPFQFVRQRGNYPIEGIFRNSKGDEITWNYGHTKKLKTYTRGDFGWGFDEAPPGWEIIHGGRYIRLKKESVKMTKFVKFSSPVVLSSVTYYGANVPENYWEGWKIIEFLGFYHSTGASHTFPLPDNTLVSGDIKKLKDQLYEDIEAVIPKPKPPLKELETYEFFNDLHDAVCKWQQDKNDCRCRKDFYSDFLESKGYKFKENPRNLK